MPPVISHTDRIHMMYVRRPPADTAPPVSDALNQIGINVIRPHQTGFIQDDSLLQRILKQCIDKLSRFCHRAVRQRKMLIISGPHHVLHLHDFFDVLHRIPCMLPDIPQSCIGFPLLERRDASPILYSHPYMADLPVSEQSGDALIRHQFNYLLPRSYCLNPPYICCKIIHVTTNTPSMRCPPGLPYTQPIPSSPNTYHIPPPPYVI